MYVFNLKLREEIDLCGDKNYYFRFTDLPPAIQEGQVVEIYLQGGIGPFIWTMISAGSAFTDATTTGKQNELTCTTLPTSGHLQFSVEDSCGTEITGELVPLDYDPGEGCTSGEPPLPLELTGDSTPVVGDVYTASEGTPPYAFSFDKGTISVTADTCTILTIDACSISGASRVGIISVQDSKLDEASIHGLLPGGDWVYVDFVYYGNGVSPYSYLEDQDYLNNNCCADFDNNSYVSQQVLLSDDSWTYPYFLAGDGSSYKLGCVQTDWFANQCDAPKDTCAFCGGGAEWDGVIACVANNRAELSGTLEQVWIASSDSRTAVALMLTDTAKYKVMHRFNYEWQCP